MADNDDATAAKDEPLVADVAAEQSDDDGLLYNGAGTIVGVTCKKCHRMLDGKKPRFCDDCKK